MISKLIRIFFFSTIISSSIFSFDSYADSPASDYEVPKKYTANRFSKKSCSKEKYKQTNQNVEVVKVVAPTALAVRNCGLMPGMVIGVNGDLGFAINENNDLRIAITNGINNNLFIASVPLTALPTNLVVTSTPIIFNANHDAAYGGEISYGYLAESGLEGNISLGYRQIKNTDRDIANQTVESDIFTAMLNGTYYATLGKGRIYPYITIGAGISRTSARGNFIDNITAAPIVPIAPNQPTTINPVVASFGGPILINFNSLRAINLAYQAGFGLSTTIESVLIGFGYKFFGVNSISGDDGYSDLEATETSTVITSVLNPVNGVITQPSTIYASSVNNRNNFRFGKLNNNIHSITLFAKLII